MSGMSRMNSNTNKKIKNVMNVTNNVNKNNIKSIDKFNNSFPRKLAGFCSKGFNGITNHFFLH